MKKCLECGEEFEGHHNAKYCMKDHYRSCANCGKEFLVKRSAISKGAKTCSPSCASKLGHTTASKQKRRVNSFKKYGTEFPSQSEEVIERIKSGQNHSEKDHRFGSDNFSKLIETKYGVENVSQLETVKDSKKETVQKNYGVDNSLSSPEVREKVKETMLKKYDVEHFSQKHIKNYDEWLNFDKWVKKNRGVTRKEAAEYFNVSDGVISTRVVKEDLQKYFAITNSILEGDFIQFLEGNFPDVRYVHNDRKVLEGMELDFYFPDHNLAVEISPARTHHSATNVNSFGSNEPKDRRYHVDKALASAEQGVELITVFDWMPWDRVLEMIKHKLSKSERIYARKCQVHYTESRKDFKELRKFVDENHVLNFRGGAKQYTYLTYNDEVVGVAAFGKPRRLSLKAKQIEDNNVELIRMVFKPGVAVVGGASRLLSSFIKNYSEPIDKIVTFSDFDLGWGNVYETLGFTETVPPRPQLILVHPYIRKDDGSAWIVKGNSLHFAGSDRLLKSFPNYEKVGMVCKCEDTFHPNAECLPKNREIVESYGFLPVYDCGYRKWEKEISKTVDPLGPLNNAVF